GAGGGVTMQCFVFPFGGAVALSDAALLGCNSLPFAALPAVIFIGPLMMWTAVNAGSPLGPLLEGITGPFPYLPNEVRSFIDDYVAGPRGPILEKLRNEAVNFSPILWLSIAGLALARRLIFANLAVGLRLFLLQVAI